jgi:hypothetical protein
VRTLDSVTVTALRFAEGEGTVELAVFGRLRRSLAQFMELDSASAMALFVEGPDSVTRLTADAAIRFPGAWRWRIPWPADSMPSLRIEAFTPKRQRAARGITVPAPWSPPSAGLYLSDILAAADSLPAGTYERWFDVEKAPLTGRLPAGRPLTLVWEVYGSPAGGDVTYEVEVRLTAEAIRRRGLVARIIGGAGDVLGLSAVGDDALVLRYQRTRQAAPALLEYLTLDLGDTPAGTYRLTLSVTTPGATLPAVAERLIEIDTAR